MRIRKHSESHLVELDDGRPEARLGHEVSRGSEYRYARENK
jgi:hypothetical protein